MEIPPSLFINSLQPGGIYYFKSNQLKSTESHFFVVITKYDDSMVLMMCSTTQYEKRVKFIQSRNLPYSTLVGAVKPDASNELTKESYFDCNHCFQFDALELLEKFKKGELKIKGNIGEAILEKLRKGLMDSPLIENEVKKLLN